MVYSQIKKKIIVGGLIVWITVESRAELLTLPGLELLPKTRLSGSRWGESSLQLGIYNGERYKHPSQLDLNSTLLL